MNQDFASLKVGLAIPTLNAGTRWQSCLDAIASQTFAPHRLLVIDSASTDSTVPLAKVAGFEVVSIKREEFNHGGTRQRAINHLSDCEIVIFLTQDAILADCCALFELLTSFSDEKVAVAYGRQLPRVGATWLEAHSREFSYGPTSLQKSRTNVNKIGAKVFFCSNSFSAYRRSALLDVGGFRNDLILGEDMEFAARAVSAGYSNHYCATATVYHSHDYSALQTLRRYFDIGVFDAQHVWMRAEFGSHKGEGFRFVLSELQYLFDRDKMQLPRALMLTVCKVLGYRLGRSYRLMPVAVRRAFSMFPRYW